MVKYVPLCGREDWYVSVGGEGRLRYEFYHNEDFGAAPADSRGNNGYLLQRYLLHGDLHLGPNLRFFGQFVTGLEDSVTHVWNPTRHLSLTSSIVHFIPGRFLKDNPPSKDLSFLTTWITYKF